MTLNSYRASTENLVLLTSAHNTSARAMDQPGFDDQFFLPLLFETPNDAISGY